MQDENTTQPDSSSSSDSSLPEPSLSLSTNPSEPSAPSADNTGDIASTDITTEPAPAVETPQEASVAETTETSSDTAQEDTSAAAEDTPATSPAPASDLESIKSSALQELTPLISELDQGPEEKYRTLMMIIQSSDNQELVKDAYDAAQKIEDKKAKAEALVNILNEINYFTGKGEKSDTTS